MGATKPNFELFKAHLRYWRETLHLANNFIEAEYDPDIQGAEVDLNHDSLVPTIRIGSVDEIWTEAVLARHEMLELLLEPLKALLWKEAQSDKTYRAGHEIIHRLENILPLPTNKEVGYVGKKKKKAKKEKEMPCGKKKKPKGK
jgi:hypothetical protein